MEKNDISDSEDVTPEIVETVPLPKPKRKITLSEEERKRRGDNLRNIVAKRKAENDKVNEVVKEDIMAVKKQTIKKISKLKMEKALALAHPDSDSDSDSSVELPSSKKKRKSKANQPIIIIKNYHHDKKKEYDASENVAKLQEMYKPEPEPVPQIRQTLGYFV
jgi:hypothetical protein